MKPELIEILRMRWQRLRIYRRPGSVLVDYRILRNFVRIYQFTGFTQGTLYTSSMYVNS